MNILKIAALPFAWCVVCAILGMNAIVCGFTFAVWFTSLYVSEGYEL